jgi:hypothetical protein
MILLEFSLPCRTELKKLGKPWRWKQYVPPKSVNLHQTTRRHSQISQVLWFVICTVIKGRRVGLAAHVAHTMLCHVSQFQKTAHQTNNCMSLRRSSASEWKNSETSLLEAQSVALRGHLYRLNQRYSTWGTRHLRGVRKIKKKYMYYFMINTE